MKNVRKSKENKSAKISYMQIVNTDFELKCYFQLRKMIRYIYISFVEYVAINKT